MRDALLGRFCLLKLDELIAAVAALDDTHANATPPAPQANSPYQLLAHCLGMLTQWSRADILGESVERDRDAEFTSSGSVEALVARARGVRERFAHDLARIDPAAPIPGRADRTDFWADSAEGILLHVFEELCQHLGHLEITRDVTRVAGPNNRPNNRPNTGASGRG